MSMTNKERKERLRRLAVLNMRAMGVYSSETERSVVMQGSSTARELLSEIRQRKVYICCAMARKGRCL